MTGFSYKTAWLAARDRTPEQVADALELHEREVLDWATGTERAYRCGIYVAAPVPGWTLAHGRMDLPAGLDETEETFPRWLREMSLRLGEVQFFRNERVPDFHTWAWARDGEVLRAYSYLGEHGEVKLFIGAPTTAEIEIGKGTGNPESANETWTDDDWDLWWQTTPSESDVMAIAGRWSVDPRIIEDATMARPGIFGMPASATPATD